MINNPRAGLFPRHAPKTIRIRPKNLVFWRWIGRISKKWN